MLQPFKTQLPLLSNPQAYYDVLADGKSFLGTQDPVKAAQVVDIIKALLEHYGIGARVLVIERDNFIAQTEVRQLLRVDVNKLATAREGGAR